MKTQAKFLNPEAMEVEVTFTATLREWKYIKDGVTTNTVPASEFAREVRRIIERCEQEFEITE
jgi:hypothetical protein